VWGGEYLTGIQDSIQDMTESVKMSMGQRDSVASTESAELNVRSHATKGVRDRVWIHMWSHVWHNVMVPTRERVEDV